MQAHIKTRGVHALIVLLDQGGIISVLTVLTNLFSSRRSSIPLLEYSVWSLNSGGSSLVALAIWTIASQKPTSSLSLVSDQLFLTLFQMLSNISISPSYLEVVFNIVRCRSPESCCKLQVYKMITQFHYWPHIKISCFSIG